MTDGQTTLSPPPGGPLAGRPEPVAENLPSRVDGLSCPSCGGALEVDSGLNVVNCPYCTQPLLALGSVGVRRFGVAPEASAEDARRETRRWLASGWNKHARLPEEAEIREAFLCFLPFFRVQADAVGAALGTEQRTRRVGSGKNRRTETYEVDVERTLERSLDRTVPALSLAEWGLTRVNLQGDRLIPYDADSLESLGMVFPPTAPEREVREAALREFRDGVGLTSGMHRVRFEWLRTLKERLTVVYYPLWLVRYRFRERSYQVLVDAEDGTLAYGKAPGNDLYRAAMLVATAAFSALVTTGALRGAFSMGHEGGLVLVAIALVVSALAFGWGWSRFRHGGVVIEGSGVGGALEVEGKKQ